jgi:hypothetical protein
MKTAKEWFQMLPEPYRTQALENSNGLERQYESLPTALFVNFTWIDTPQKGEYWNDIHERSIDGKFDINLHGWIPVSERLPEEIDADENGEILILKKGNIKKIVIWFAINPCKPEVTHWQPLPKLPETI